MAYLVNKNLNYIVVFILNTVNTIYLYAQYIKILYAILITLLVIVGIPMWSTYLLVLWSQSTIDYSSFNEYLFMYISLSIPFSIRSKSASISTYYYCNNPVAWKDTDMLKTIDINFDIEYFIKSKYLTIERDINSLPPLHNLSKTFLDSYFNNLCKAILSIHTQRLHGRLEFLSELLVKSYNKFEYHKYYVQEAYFTVDNWNNSYWSLRIEFFKVDNLYQIILHHYCISQFIRYHSDFLGQDMSYTYKINLASNLMSWFSLTRSDLILDRACNFRVFFLLIKNRLQHFNETGSEGS